MILEKIFYKKNKQRKIKNLKKFGIGGDAKLWESMTAHSPIAPLA